MIFFHLFYRLRFFIFFFFIFAVFTVSVRAEFTDISREYEHFSAIEFLKNKGIINGYPDGSFKPDENVSRVEAIKVIVVALNLNKSYSDQTVRFKDLDSSAWYFPYVLSALKIGIVQGYSDAIFGPDRPINRAEFLKILFLADNITQEKLSAPLYPDVPVSAWFAVYIAGAKKMKLIASESDGNFKPAKLLTRNEIAEITYRFLKIKEHKTQFFNPSTDWRSSSFPSHYTQIKISPRYSIINQNSSEVVIMSKESAENLGHTRFVETGAVISISVKNELSLDRLALQNKLKSLVQRLEKGILREVSFNDGLIGFLVFGESSLSNILDLYVILPDKKVLKILGNYSLQTRVEDLKEELYLMEMSFKYLPEGGPSIDQILSIARERIYSEGKGKETLDSFPEELIIIETDSIGTGEGPIDYYYSEKGNVTIKYQRSRDVILGIRSGKSSGF